MKKAIEEFTGTIGIGCLVSLGLFFLTDSQFRYWNAIEQLMGTNSWGILVSVPILIINYIFGLITIELGEIILPKLLSMKVQKEFQENLKKVARLNNKLITSRYNEVYQNKRILNGSSIGFILISIGVFLEGIDFWGEFRVIGIIGMAGSLIVTVICPIIGLRIQLKFNQSIEDYKN
jgi:hypothetical protein